MGNREDLLRGARRCLEERGWANTTARDIAAAAGGVSHAAIFYHFGSREALLTAALIEAIEATFQEAVAHIPAGNTAAGFNVMWADFAENFEAQRGAWLAHFEAVLHAQRAAPLRRQLTDIQTTGRIFSTAWLTGTDEADLTTDDDRVRSLGSVYLALVAGVAWQYLVDPDTAPRPGDITAGIRALSALLEPSPTSETP
ncbi:TetR/AcrR family transcriptional regulator [Nocardia asiatica]|uniref:TetR/AcrR family transcriptional regulator n=1 Tax=Nocardia asiatica TaxID=209252 RepID=UPI003EDFC58B